MLEVENAEGLDLTYQPEVLTAFERFGIAIVKGLESIKSDFPQYTDLIDKSLKPEVDLQRNVDSIYGYVRRLEKEFVKVRQDESFMEAIAYLTLAAMLDQDSLRDSVLLPMMEYFESNAAMKAFLDHHSSA